MIRLRFQSGSRAIWASAILATIVAPPVGRLLAETVPPRGAVDSRIRVVPYNAEEVYKLRGYVGYQIDLEFESGETFNGLGAGDIEGLSFVGQENHLFIKPKAARVATNLTVLTNRREYQIDYSVLSRPRGGDAEDLVYSLRFTYPRAGGSAEEESTQVESSLGAAFGNRPQNLDYWYCGAPTLQPVAASDDGVHTRLQFSARTELPAVFIRNDDGSESLVNFSMKDGDLLIHRVARRFVIRRGRLTGCIVNKGFKGSGDRLDSGTISPDVERHISGARP
ncbi:MAG TPA: TrbG/VirB9 family P-type conjugative transfer protein [Steroidobacteraceae bacterium]|nr:TrbG/VirB9 family P-type conjugative transfer protein [Steroidobacteraceae bacterium]